MVWFHALRSCCSCAEFFLLYFLKVEEGKNSLTDEVILDRLRSFCAYRERSEYEIIQHSRKWQLPAEKIHQFILQLKKEDFLNEQRFAKSFSEGKLRIKGWGKLKVKQALRQKGIKDSLVETSIHDLSEEEYNASLKKNLEKKAATLKKFSVQQQKQKLIQFLLQKGFESDLVWKNVSDYFRQKK